MRRLRYPDDEGIAMVMALAVASIVMVLGLTMMTYTLYTTGGSGYDRQRSTAINAAEAGIDSTYAALQSAGTSLPCTQSGGVQASPDTSTYTVAITYYDSSNTALACSGGYLPSTSVPAAADIVSTAVMNRNINGEPAVRRVMEAYVQLTPVRDNGFNKAIFANSGLSVNNKSTLNGNSGSDADIYTNSDFSCANNETFHGTVYSQGTVSIQGSCMSDGGIWAKNGIVAQTGANGSFGGKFLVSNGNINLSQASTSLAVQGPLQASGTISWNKCTSTLCFGSATVATPPYQPFPILRSDTSTRTAWVNQGYVEKDFPNGSGLTGSDCVEDSSGSSKGQNAVTKWIVANASSLSSDTLINTACEVDFPGTGTIKLAKNLALFASGGITASNQVKFDSTISGTTRYLYWVVPYDAAPSTYPTSSCSSPLIQTGNQFSVTTSVNMLVYSPCAINFSNSSTHMGQIFGGSQVTINNQFNMDYTPLPVFGVDPNSLPTLSYDVDVAYKREIR